MTIDTAELRRWQGGSMGAFDLSDLRLAVNGREALRLGRLEQRDIHLPHEDTLRRLMDVADKTGAGMDRALAALIPLTDSMLAANPPLLGGPAGRGPGSEPGQQKHPRASGALPLAFHRTASQPEPGGRPGPP